MSNNDYILFFIAGCCAGWPLGAATMAACLWKLIKIKTGPKETLL
ncbi:MAG: hypothetical protein ACOYYS_19370 [Chloroflexota bacterium]